MMRRIKSVIVFVASILGLYFVHNSLKTDKSNNNGLLTFGKEGTRDFRLFLTEGSQMRSFWADVPVRPVRKPGAAALTNMVVEIPRLHRAKMEIHKTEPFNPIFQDLRNGKLRFLHAPLAWHYGSVPQTLGEDGDPLDVLDISDTERTLGEVVGVKILGALPLLDDDHLDWKLVGIAEDDPVAPELATLGDAEELLPGVVGGIIEYFRWYDFPETKKYNVYAGDNLGPEKTAALVEAAHREWQAKFAIQNNVNEK